ncbi:MAG TPA: bifunctional DNA-binding transcriptional regulator/O6-methylguanine-DNA methyltransferase Ada [Gemmatimonadales bacterium]
MTTAAAVPILTATRQWQIVLARDRRYDGDFVYAVRSTGIYCRPSCPSRRPRRTLVRFFPIPEAAEAAGFRACRRCHPGRLQPHDPAVALVRDVCRAIDAQPDGPADLAGLGRLVGRSPHQVLRAFRRVLGVSPREYRDARRVGRLKSSLKEMPHVSPAIYEAGFGSSSRVYERAAGTLGMTPATYARGGRGATITYSVVPSPLGSLLVAATERGICRIALGDSAAALERDLRREFPAARIALDTGRLKGWVETILEHLAGNEPHLDLPLDIRATAFQQKVWTALRKIPYGSTRSYQAVARSIGRPTATRAVARACATNPVALVIPCHRVVREDGQPGGYRWGAERKDALLQREKDD